MSKPILKIVYTDCGDDFKGSILRALSPRFDLVETTVDSDLCVYSTFSNNHRKYNCKKLWISGENDYPDFNVCDYAISCHNLDYSGHHLRVPFYAFRGEYTYLKTLKYDNIDTDKLFNRKFCSALISDKEIMDPRRKIIFDTVNSYSSVDSAGSYKNSTGRLDDLYDRKDWEGLYEHFTNPQKHVFIREYKFNLALENSIAEGYVTEKIIDAFCARTIPIYFGTPDVVCEFNPDAYIYATGMSDEELRNKLNTLNTDKEAYMKMLTADKFITKINYTEKLNAFLNHVADGDKITGHKYGWMKYKQ